MEGVILKGPLLFWWARTVFNDCGGAMLRAAQSRVEAGDAGQVTLNHPTFTIATAIPDGVYFLCTSLWGK